MNGEQRSDYQELISRFDAGDRSPDLIALLNRAAFHCFHAPWEFLPHPKPKTIPALEVEFLRAEPDHEGEDESALEAGDLDLQTDFKFDREPAVLETTQDSPAQDPSRDPLEYLKLAVEMLVHQGQLSQGFGLVVDLPYDPKADNQSRMVFRVDGEQQWVLVLSHSDLPIVGLSEIELERLCKVYNRRNLGLEAKTYRPQEGARLRLRLTTAVPIDLMGADGALENHLVEVFQKDRQFWRYVRRCLPA